MERILRQKLKGGRFSKVSPKRSQIMRSIKSKGNRSTEFTFKMALVRANISGWKLHPKDVIGCPDVFFSIHKIAVFLDGCFWHGCPICGHVPITNHDYWLAKIKRNKQRDIKKRNILKRQGIKVIRFWEHEIKKHPQKCIDKIDKIIQ